MNTTSLNSGEDRPAKSNRYLANWLFTLCGMVFIMVVLGGLTRLTHSGLSMVDWRPITGWLPPLSPGEWQSIFDLYRETPQYLKINAGMTVEEFKSIFWLEYLHRLWGRAIGIIFLLPFMVFLFKGWVSWKLAPHFVLIFVLGGLQGVLGWYMVKSGLIDNPDVSQYRLTAHFSAAVVIYGYMLWVGLSLIKTRRLSGEISRALRIGTLFTTAWIFLTMMSGGFVAGLDAGFTYNTFPLMDGRFVPEDLYALSPWHLNWFENITAVQFNHRILAEMTLIFVIGIWLLMRKSDAPMSTRQNFHALLGMTALQVALGISTLLLVVPISLAALHQAGALLVLTFALMALHSLLGRPYAA